MSERRKAFIRSLGAEAPTATPSCSSRVGGPGRTAPVDTIIVRSESVAERSADSKRKRHISMLAHEDGPPAVPTPPSGVLGVEFSLEGLLDFRDAADGIQFGKAAEEARPLPRKRPNYNGSNRKFLAKIHDRQKLLRLDGP